MNPLFHRDPPEWTSKEAKELRDFLTSDTGTKMLTLCQFQTPDLLNGENVNVALVRSGEHKGFEDAIAFVVGLTHTEPTPEPARPNYPSLDDDSQWKDEPPATK